MLKVEMSQFHKWYPHFKKVSFKAEIIPLSKRIVNYLTKDGVFLPEEEPTEEDSSDSDSDEEVSQK